MTDQKIRRGEIKIGSPSHDKKSTIIFLITAAIAGGIFFIKYPATAATGGAAKIDADVRLAVCGNGAVDSGEQCDGQDLAGKSCISYGFIRGTVSCKPSCEVDLSGCVRAAPPSSGGGGGGAGSAINNTPAAKEAAAENKAVFNPKADLNSDGRIDLIDFSIAAYWYKREFLPAAKRCDLNSDGRIDLIDFSILAYFWTK